jgi:hypothetical protein
MALNEFLTEAIRMAPTAVAAFTANRKTSAERRQQELLNQQLDLQRQAFDPSSPLYQQQLAIENANSGRNIARTIEEMTRQQRRNVGMGRNPLIDNERADEVMNRLQQTEAANAAAAAPERARRNILTMAENMGNTANTFGGMIQNQAQRQNTRASVLTDLSKGVADSIINRWGFKEPAQPAIQQATPTPNTAANTMTQEMIQRRQGGMNMANLPIMQNMQRSASRPFQGGRSFS